MSIFFDPKEHEFFDCVNEELARLAGTTVKYWRLNVEATDIDYLYNEPEDKWEFVGEFQVAGHFFDFEDVDDPEEAGQERGFTGSVVIPRKTLEDIGILLPEAGDIIEVWNRKWDIIDADPEGFHGPDGFYTQHRISITRNDRFVPERRDDDE